MRNPFFYILLIGLVVLDGWLLAHPNLVGQLRVFYFDQTYLETFPQAVGTVATIVGGAVILSWIIGRLGRGVGMLLLLLLLAVSGYWLLQTINQFSSGVEQFTGGSYRAGAMLLPGLVVLVFAKAVFDLFGKRR